MISVSKLSKRYGSVDALREIDLELRAGVITAIAGPNGSGKSTLLKSILGLVKPDSGSIAIAGAALNGQPEYRRHIGYMPQKGQFPANLRISEVIGLVKSVREDIPVTDEYLLTELGLHQELPKRIRTLSGGTRQKLNALIAFLFNPQLYILDEPTASLDPIASGILKAAIRQKRDEGRSIILSSHIPSEIEDLADDVVFLCEGKVVYSGSKQNLLAKAQTSSVEKAFAGLMQGDKG